MIPKIIHQVWSDIKEPLPDFFGKLSQTWKKHHPDWKYEFWDEERMNHYVENCYPQYLETYNNFPYNVQRWDAIRYLFLYQMGGMYVDFDSECLEPHDDLFKDKTCCFSMEPKEHGKVFNKDIFFNNALIAVIPEHPFIKVVINHVFNNLKKVQFTTLHNKGMEVQESTGPLTLVRLYENYPNKDNIYLIPAEYVSPFTKHEVINIGVNGNNAEVEKRLEKAYSVHFFFNTWTKGMNATS